ncbi:hypothetical protein ACQ5SO_10980 [Rhodovulum sp. DZ06]|uniref:hypothetical protein n=1 Tax=Rhodovulum sp. DZ06 TaxID=3425126 RepID=UPI003D3474D4
MKRSIVAAVLCAALAGCGAQTIQSAQKVGDAGVAASEALLAQAQTATGAHKSIRIYYNTQTLLKNGQTLGVVPSESKQVTKALEEREQAYGRLVKAYAAFDALANLNAREDVSESIAGLLTQYEALRVAAEPLYDKGLPELKKVDEDDALLGAVNSALGLLVQAQQAKALKASNDVFVAVLPELINFVALERAAMVSSMRASASARSNLVRALYEEGLADSSPLAVEMTALAGVGAVKNPGAVIAKDPALRANFIEYAKYRDQEAQAVLLKQYDKVAKQLGDLLKRHEEFAKGGVRDVAAIKADAEALLELVEAFRKARPAL